MHAYFHFAMIIHKALLLFMQKLGKRLDTLQKVRKKCEFKMSQGIYRLSAERINHETKNQGIIVASPAGSHIFSEPSSA